jgi:hypothetical protein
MLFMNEAKKRNKHGSIEFDPSSSLIEIWNAILLCMYETR